MAGRCVAMLPGAGLEPTLSGKGDIRATIANWLLVALNRYDGRVWAQQVSGALPPRPTLRAVRVSC